MFKTQIFDTLKKYIGDYLYGFNQDQLKLGLLNGNIKLKNLTFKPEKVNEHLILMRSPVVLKAGLIGNITLEINYLDMSKTSFLIEDLFIILGPNFSELKKREVNLITPFEIKDYVNNDQQFLMLAKKLEDFDNFNSQKGIDPEKRALQAQRVMNTERQLTRLMTMAQDPNGQKFKQPFDNVTNIDKTKGKDEDIFRKILNNDYFAASKVIIKNIHVRYEDDQLFPRHPLSFGVLIDSILIHPNPNIDIYIPLSKDAQSYGYYQAERKILDEFLKSTKYIPIYLLISKTEEKFDSTNCYEYHSEMYIPYSLYEATLYSENGIFDAMDPVDLRGLMKQYLTRQDYYKFNLVKIERVESHAMIASNQLLGAKKQNFALVNCMVYNMYLNVRPTSIEDLLDFTNYFLNFSVWQVMKDLKPSIRPILNKKLTQSRSSTNKLKTLIIREWWKSVLWFLRAKKVLMDKRDEIIPDLKREYENSSWIRLLENFQPGKGINSPTMQMSTNFARKLFDEKQEAQTPIFGTLEKKEDPAMKNLFLMVFCNVSNINIALQKDNSKTFLLVKVESVHINAFKNIDFVGNNSAAFHLTNLRLFLYQSEKSKRIFGASPKKDPNNFDFGNFRNRTSVIAGQSLMTTNQNLAQKQHQEEYYEEKSDYSYSARSNIKNIFNKEQVIMHESMQSDLLLLELKNDLIMKVTHKPLTNGTQQYQVKVELNEIVVNLETKLIQDLIEYWVEIQKIYYYRYISFTRMMKDNFHGLKFKLQRKVISFDQEFEKSYSFISNATSPGRNKERNTRNGDPREMTSSPQRFYNDGNVDVTQFFLDKLEAFLRYHEILVSMNLDPININISQNTHSISNRVDLLGIQFPQGKIVLSFNYNKKNFNIVDIYGFKLETSSRFHAIYYLMKVFTLNSSQYCKKMKKLVKDQIEDNVDLNVKFFDLMVSKENLQNPMNLEFVTQYAKKQKFGQF